MNTILESRTELPTGTWQVDPVHSSVTFSVKHMVVANFRGGFGAFDVTLDDDGLQGSVDVTSVDVADQNLEDHLLSPEFFDAERYPAITFSSKDIRLDDGEIDVQGELSLKGVTRPVSITGRINGPVAHAYDGSLRLGLELETVVDRTAFGLDWNAPLPTGGFALGNDVKLYAELELVQAA